MFTSPAINLSLSIPLPALPGQIEGALAYCESDAVFETASDESLDAEPVDLARLRAIADDDPKNVRELVDMYLTESVELMRKLRSAIHRGSAKEVEWVAHRLGGSSATCGMTGIVAPLRELERSGNAGIPENERLLLEADRQHARICAFLYAFVCQSL
jgi:HPt (histidine-containing phosphotransfer) domain-containing protein